MLNTDNLLDATFIQHIGSVDGQLITSLLKKVILIYLFESYYSGKTTWAWFYRKP
jgi:hypothetical protein